MGDGDQYVITPLVRYVGLYGLSSIGGILHPWIRPTVEQGI